jgi:hypothetical protein
VEPASFGLPAVGDRRVEGLRREEVAVTTPRGLLAPEARALGMLAAEAGPAPMNPVVLPGQAGLRAAARGAI